MQKNPLLRIAYKVIVPCALLLTITGCGKQLRIKSNTFADARAIPQGFPLHSAFSVTPLLTDNQLLSKELTQKITKILTDKGYKVTKTPSAQYHLEFSYQMQSATRTVTVPHYVSGPAQITQGTVFGSDGCTHYQEQTQATGTIVYTAEEQTYFITTLTLEVYDAQEDVEIWQGSATTSTDSCDIRDTLDYLLVTAFKHFGKNTYKDVYANVQYKNKEISALRIE